MNTNEIIEKIKEHHKEIELILITFTLAYFIWLANTDLAQREIKCGQVWSVVEDAHNCITNQTFPKVLCFDQRFGVPPTIKIQAEWLNDAKK